MMAHFESSQFAKIFYPPSQPFRVFLLRPCYTFKAIFLANCNITNVALPVAQNITCYTSFLSPAMQAKCCIARKVVLQGCERSCCMWHVQSQLATQFYKNELIRNLCWIEFLSLQWFCIHIENLKTLEINFASYAL